MGFDINVFKTNGITNGGARPSLFDVQFTPPAIGAGNVTQKIPFFVSAANLPASEIGIIEVPYFGRKIKVAGDRTYPNWTFKVMLDEDFALRTMFEQWANFMNQTVANLRSPDVDGASATGPSGYKTDFVVTQYAKDGTTIQQYTIVGGWPTNVEAIPLDWNTTNTIEEFNVTIAYDYWTIASGALGAGST